LRNLFFTAAAVIACAITAVSAAGPQATTTPQHGNTAPPAPKASQPTTGVITTGGPVSSIRPVPDSHKFLNGQILHYSAEWRLWTAGTATIKLEQINGEERVSASADSAGAVAVLYRVADRFESYFDRKSFCSLRLNKHSEEGLHSRETKIEFDYNKHKAVLDERNLKTRETKHTEEGIPNCVTDVLAGLYYVGSMPLETGSTYVFPINDGGKTYDVKAVVEGHEEIKTDAGTFRTVRVQPSAEGGLLKTRGKIWIWYSDDAAHIPVQMRARMFWGTLTFKLNRVERQTQP
jgi:Protein of unknown function (DUF3108)